MLIKEKDSQEVAIQELEAITQLADVSKDIRTKAKRELRALVTGSRGEDNAAYFINFNYRDKRNWAVIHDLRIEYDGFVAQIDHLMIGRMLEFYVLESKSFSQGIKITERGEFLAWYYKRYHPIESPIEQNKRHIVVLEKLLIDKVLLPKRLGMTIKPTFRPYVLISPKSRVIRPKSRDFNTDEVIKMDEFARQVDVDGDEMNPVATVGFVAKMISEGALEELAKSLTKYHTPAPVDYYAKYGIQRIAPILKPDKNEEAEGKSSRRNFCAKCGKSISKKVAIYCFQNKERFDGKAYCYDCQRTI